MRGRLFALVVLLMLPLGTGCSNNAVRRYVLETRNRQGDMALANDNYQDASVSYRLALRIDPKNAHARAGQVAVQIKLASQFYRKSDFEDALGALAVASKYDPQNVRVDEIRSEIEQARTLREIVVANYPTYRENGQALRRSYATLKGLSNRIVGQLQLFDFTYDSSHLTAALADSYALGEEVNRNTNRLINYRQLVESGAPELGKKGGALAPAASLLPLP
ncbi:MAG: hypothetical protein ABI346_04025 [Candidatus Baltobacteraceae bacterium]